MRVVYIADDGTEFDSREECEFHEWDAVYQKVGKTIVGLDSGFNIVPFADPNFLYESNVIICTTYESLKALRAKVDDSHFYQNCMSRPGVYLKNFGNFPEANGKSWLHIEDLNETYEKAVKECEDFF